MFLDSSEVVRGEELNLLPHPPDTPFLGPRRYVRLSTMVFTGRRVCRDDNNTTPVSLDVGGTVYTASRSVLRAVPDSWLARVVNGGIGLPRNAQDMRFIERDSKVRVKMADRATIYCPCCNLLSSILLKLRQCDLLLRIVTADSAPYIRPAGT